MLILRDVGIRLRKETYLTTDLPMPIHRAAVICDSIFPNLSVRQTD